MSKLNTFLFVFVIALGSVFFVYNTAFANTIDSSTTDSITENSCPTTEHRTYYYCEYPNTWVTTTITYIYYCDGHVEQVVRVSKTQGCLFAD